MSKKRQCRNCGKAIESGFYCAECKKERRKTMHKEWSQMKRKEQKKHTSEMESFMRELDNYNDKRSKAGLCPVSYGYYVAQQNTQAKKQ